MEYDERLRERAESLLNKNVSSVEDLSYSEICNLVHELSVLQIELKMQNDELRNTEREVEKQRDNYQELYEFAPIGYITVNIDDTITNVNLRCIEMLDYDKSEFIDKPFSSFIVNEDQDIFYLARQKMLNNKENISSKLRLKIKSGEYLNVGLESCPIDDVDGKIVGFRMTITDLSEIIRAEEERQKQEKLQSLGILAGGIAHDFNNILTSLYGYIDLANTHVDGKSDVGNYLNNAMVCFERSRSLTQQLLTFAKGGSPIKKRIDIIPLIKESINIALSGSNVVHSLKLLTNKGICDADPGQLSQVFINLLINARQAMADGGTILVEVDYRHVKELEIAKLDGGEYLVVKISDNGTGIPPHLLSHIFDPYFSTKKAGSGLGLATSFSIIKKHCGIVDVTSVENVGTNFEIYLPASDMNIVEEIENSPGNIKKSAKILVLEDEEMLNYMVCEMINSFGYTVKAVKVGEDAIFEYKKALNAGEKYDLLLFDLTICGGLGGKDAMARILEIDKDAKGIVTSGYSEDPVLSDPKKYGFLDRISKPFNRTELYNALNRVLVEQD